MGGARERLIEERDRELLSRSHTLSYTPVDLPLYHISAELAERHTATASELRLSRVLLRAASRGREHHHSSFVDKRKIK